MKSLTHATQKTAIALLIAGAVFCVVPAKVSACDIWCNLGVGLGLNAVAGVGAQFGIGVYPYGNIGVSGGIGGYGGYNYTQYPNLQYVYNQPTQSQPSQYNYVQYPTLTYKYTQNPAPKDPLAEFYNSYAQYPQMTYVYHGQNVADVQAEYDKYAVYSTPIQTSNQQMYRNNYTNSYGSYAGSQSGYGNSGSGFTMTSGY